MSTARSSAPSTTSRRRRRRRSRVATFDFSDFNSLRRRDDSRCRTIIQNLKLYVHKICVSPLCSHYIIDKTTKVTDLNPVENMFTERKTNRSSTSRQSSKRFSNSVEILDAADTMTKTNFVVDFLKLCKGFDVSPLPLFHIIGAGDYLQIISSNSEDQLSRDESEENQLQDRKAEDISGLGQKLKTESETVTVFSLIYESSIDLEAPKDLRCRGYGVTECMRDALIICAKKFTTLTTLKLQRCSINATGIVKISEILAPGSGCSIKDLSLDVNPSIKQNHHLLCAPGSSLLYLSLKLCEINDDGCARIASNLSHHDEPHAPKLIALNLANNRISEMGARAIGRMLRTNRSLRSLTLTGNRINDDGTEHILEQLSAFTLTHAEVVEKRRRKINRLKLCNDKMDNLSSQALEKTASEGKSRRSSLLENRVSKKRRGSTRQVISMSRESSVNRSTPIIVQSLEEKAEAMIPVDTHPLVKDVIPINGFLSCPGNFKLQHLNLSFNSFGEDTLRGIIDCVEKQQATLFGDVTKGLQHVNVEGNEFDESCYLGMQLAAAIHQRRSFK